MNAQHTPGPWAFSQSAEYGDTRFYVAQADGAPYTPHYSDVATLIAETVSDERRSIQEANASLIATAPELLEALKKMEFAFSPFASDCTLANLIDQSRAVIAKATGGAS